MWSRQRHPKQNQRVSKKFWWINNWSNRSFEWGSWVEELYEKLQNIHQQDSAWKRKLFDWPHNNYVYNGRLESVCWPSEPNIIRTIDGEGCCEQNSRQWLSQDAKKKAGGCKKNMMVLVWYKFLIFLIVELAIHQNNTHLYKSLSNLTFSLIFILKFVVVDFNQSKFDFRIICMNYYLFLPKLL